MASSTRPSRLLAALLALLCSLTLLSGAVPASATKRPPAPTNAPADIEDLAAYVAENSCTPTTRPGAAKLARLLVKTYPNSSWGGARACGSVANSEHFDGRAIDWMNSARSAKQKKQAEAVIAWLFAPDAQGRPYANARRLGIMYLIWDNHIWGAYRPEDGWREYRDCTSKKMSRKSLDSYCHRNHMHLSLSWAGATGKTSWWTGVVAAPDYGRCRPADMSWAYSYAGPNPVPCPEVGRVKAPKGASKTLKTIVADSGRVMRLGSHYGGVKAVQKTIGAKQTGSYSAATVKKMKTWQTAHGLEPTGTLNYDTWRALEVALVPASARLDTQQNAQARVSVPPTLALRSTPIVAP